jgi:DNA modification methylase
MDGCIAEICFTSPPYADQREYNGDKDLSTQHIATFIRSAYGKVNYFVVNLGYSRKDQEVNLYWEDYTQEAKNCGLKLLSWNIWDRSGFGYTVGQATAMFTIDHEWIFVFGNKAKELNKTVENKQSGVAKKGTIRQKNGETTAVFTETHSHRQIGTIIRCDVARYKGGDHTHPAMFPVELAETYIESMTGNKDIVYEPFCGSGTTMIACEKLGRTNFSMELDPKYCDVIVKRWEDFTGKKAELLI